MHAIFAGIERYGGIQGRGDAHAELLDAGAL